MIPFLAWLESTGVSVWIRESPSILAFPGILSCHAIGMGFAAGVNAVDGVSSMTFWWRR